MRRWSLLLALLLLSGGANVAQAQSSGSNPLFAEHSALRLTLEGPFTLLRQTAAEREDQDGRLTYREPDGRAVTLDAELRVRGRSRLALCDFPPLRLDFKRGQVGGTVFAGQNLLKLVTLCRDSPEYRIYLAKEYGIYLAFNALTGSSFRVRWAEIDYVDTAGQRRETFTAPAFLIEHEDELAARTGMQVRESESLDLADLDARHTALLSLFQFMIGHTDWSVLQGPPGEPCCHNGIPLQAADGHLTVVPYDFDQAGIIDAEYASPAVGLPIRSVRRRLYRGFCAFNGELGAAIAQFNGARAPVVAALTGERLSERQRARSAGYLAEFYEIINDPLRRETDLFERCRS